VTLAIPTTGCILLEFVFLPVRSLNFWNAPAREPYAFSGTAWRWNHELLEIGKYKIERAWQWTIWCFFSIMFAGLVWCHTWPQSATVTGTYPGTFDCVYVTQSKRSSKTLKYWVFCEDSRDHHIQSVFSVSSFTAFLKWRFPVLDRGMKPGDDNSTLAGIYVYFKLYAANCFEDLWDLWRRTAVPLSNLLEAQTESWLHSGPLSCT